MKKYILFALPILAACSQNVEPEIISALQMEITASISDDTRTAVIDGGTSVYWQPGDAIAVFRGSSRGFFSTNIESEAGSALFRGTIYDDPGEGELVGVYPYSNDFTSDGNAVSLSLPDVQNAVAGSFGQDLYITMGHTDTDRMHFFALCGGFRFTLSQPGIKRIRFEAAGGEYIAGQVKAAFVNELPEVREISGGKTGIDLYPPEGETFRTDTWYYIVAFPAELPEGFRMFFYKDEAWGAADYPSPVSIKRGAFGSKKNVDAGVYFDGIYEPEAVDLGLSVMWASFNLGASAPETAGDFYSWGDTEPFVSKDAYKWISDGKLTGYNTDSRYGAVDNLTTLKPKDDAAAVKWGGAWRMPTAEEMDELVDPLNCKWEWTQRNGVNGYLVSSLKEGYEGASIFLPAGGWCYGYGISNAGSRGWYWTSSLNTGNDGDGPMMARVESFTSGGYKNKSFGNRKFGANIRPVFSPGAVPDAIDLGLSVKWASFNVGASAPGEFGLFFQWGDTEEHGEYAWSSYIWCGGSSRKLTKYNTSSDYGKVDNRIILEPHDDAAHVYYGGKWRMPTREECEELWTSGKCSWVKTTQDGVAGYLVTSNVEGYTDRSVFFPFTGYKVGQVFSTHYNLGILGYFWSSSLRTDNPSEAYHINLSPEYLGNKAYVKGFGRATAIPVRAVLE